MIDLAENVNINSAVNVSGEPLEEREKPSFPRSRFHVYSIAELKADEAEHPKKYAVSDGALAADLEDRLEEYLAEHPEEWTPEMHEDARKEKWIREHPEKARASFDASMAKWEAEHPEAVARGEKRRTERVRRQEERERDRLAFWQETYRIEDMLREDFPDATDERIAELAPTLKLVEPGTGMLQEKLAEILEGKPANRNDPKPAAKSRYVVHRRGDYRNRKPAPLLIDDLFMPQVGVGMIAAKRSGFKSFIALGIGAAVATGKPAFGSMKVNTSGLVIYAGGEGMAGVEDQRVPALEIDMGLDLADYSFGTLPGLPVAGNSEDVAEWMAGVDAYVKAEGRPVRLVILDTLNKMMPGMDENSAGVMSAVLHATAEALVARHGCFVVIIHHFGKDEAKGGRGSSALDAALDWFATIEAIQDRDRGLYLAAMRIGKEKDGDGEGALTYFRGRKVALGNGIVGRDTSLAFRIISEAEYKAAKPGAPAGEHEGSADIRTAQAVLNLQPPGVAFSTPALAHMIVKWLDPEFPEVGHSLTVEQAKKVEAERGKLGRLIRAGKVGRLRLVRTQPKPRAGKPVYEWSKPGELEVRELGKEEG